MAWDVFFIISPNSYCQFMSICLMSDDMDNHFTAFPHAVIQLFISQMLSYAFSQYRQRAGYNYKSSEALICSICNSYQFFIYFIYIYSVQLDWMILSIVDKKTYFNFFLPNVFVKTHSTMVVKKLQILFLPSLLGTIYTFIIIQLSIKNLTSKILLKVNPLHLLPSAFPVMGSHSK